MIPSSWKSAFVLPLLKGGDPSVLDNYRPISRLSVIAIAFDSLVNEQLKHFSSDNKILSQTQSGFRQGHSTITAAISVTNDIITALDDKKSCAALFIDLSKAFDSVDHGLLLQRLNCIGFSNPVLSWFSNYLTGRTQCVSIDNYNSVPLTVKTGVPQGSILGPILFSIYINDLGVGLNPAKVHLYADDTIIYTIAPSLKVAMDSLQTAFNLLQMSLVNLKLVLNSKKTKCMIFSHSRSSPTDRTVLTLDGTQLERVSSYKYLGIWIDDKMTFSVHIDSLLKKTSTKVRLLFSFKKMFSFYC